MAKSSFHCKKRPLAGLAGPDRGRIVAAVALAALALFMFHCGLSAQSSDLAAYWKLDEESGVRSDAAGDNDLTDNNTTGYGGGVLGNAAEFIAANNEYLSLADNPDTSMGDVDFTIAAWIKFSEVTSGTAIIQKSGEYRIQTNASSELGFVLENGANSVGVWMTDTITNTWYFVVGYHDATNDLIGVSLNGGAVEEFSYTGGVSDTAEPLLFGYDGISAYFDGLIDEVGIWSRVLKPQEIQWLYAEGDGLTYPFPNGIYMPVTLKNVYGTTGDPGDNPLDPDPDDDGEEEVVILGPPQDDNTWRAWAEAIDDILDPIQARIEELLIGVNDLNARGCGINESFVANDAMLASTRRELTVEGFAISAPGAGFVIDPDATFQENSRQIGMALGEPVGWLRAFLNSQIAPVSYITVSINYLIAAVVFIVSVEAFIIGLWLVRVLIDVVLALWGALPFT